MDKSGSPFAGDSAQNPREMQASADREFSRTQLPFICVLCCFCSGFNMCFEIRERDLLGRIARLECKGGVVETPLLFPVVNPSTQPISPKNIREVFGCEALITNAYILKKRFQNEHTGNSCGCRYAYD